MAKKTSKKTEAKTEFYIVGWADYYPDAKLLSSGFLSDIFSSKKKAMDAAMEQVKCAAQDAWDKYENPEEEYGVSSVEDLVMNMIIFKKDDEISTFNLDNDTLSHYTVKKFSTKYIK